jgi:hypothetical protein
MPQALDEQLCYAAGGGLHFPALAKFLRAQAERQERVCSGD